MEYHAAIKKNGVALYILHMGSTLLILRLCITMDVACCYLSKHNVFMYVHMYACVCAYVYMCSICVYAG